MTRCRRHNDALMEKRLRFRSEFLDELDILNSSERFPEWVYRYREPLLDKISNPVKQLARLLKDCGIVFKLKWPLEVNDSYKFADIYIPATDTVIIVAPKSELLRPTLFMDEKAEIFRQNHRDVRQFGYDVFDNGHEDHMDLLTELQRPA